MSRTSLLQTPSHGALLFRLAGPAAILFALTLTAVFGTIMWMSRTANEGAAERQRAQLQQVVAKTLDGLSARLAELEPPEGRSPAASAAFDSLFRLDAENPTPPPDAAGLWPGIRTLAETRSPTAVLFSDGVFLGRAGFWSA
jgi:hypothetical protein